MALIKDNQIIADTWVWVGDEEEIDSAADHVLVSLKRWNRDKEVLKGRNCALGVRLHADEPPRMIEKDLAHFQLIALEFPAFKDGRAFSYARLLRERYGFKGELRAVGDVLRDQLLFMQRCGFDAFEINSDKALEIWNEAMREVSVFYQPTADGRVTVMERRHPTSSESHRKVAG